MIMWRLIEGIKIEYSGIKGRYGLTKEERFYA